jgi:hypothetical protein
VLLALAIAPAGAAAQGGGGPSDVLGGAGKRGKATIWQGTCKYSFFSPQGVLQVGAPAPHVSGANTRRGTRRERTYVRFRVWVTNAFNGATLTSSGWSEFLRVRQSGTRTWPSPTVFTMVWEGNYGTDIRIEWWNSKRRIGWRAYRTQSFQYWDQYNRGPFGPLSSCYKPTQY